MIASTVTKDQIREKIGKKWWLDDQQMLAAKLDYVSGINHFDQILDGKSLEEINGVIHLEKYPKGILFKIATNLGFKLYPFPVSNTEIESTILSETSENEGYLSFNLSDRNEINFLIKKGDVSDVKKFLKEIKLEFETKKITKLPIDTVKHMEKISTSQNLNHNQKHSLPALLSFFIPGLGQVIKGEFLKGFLIWLVGGIVIFIFSISVILIPFAFVIWAWNIYDAYNHNKPSTRPRL